MERPNQIYVSYRVRKSLWLLARAQTDEIALVTADELADRILQNYLNSHCPWVGEYLDRVDKEEKQLIKTLTKQEQDEEP
jgi:predicted metal-dependent hydrolase